MTYFQAIILSIIEGVTEFLPISSTGHLILAQKLLGITTTEFTKSFDILIQLSAILAVVVLYRKKILSSVFLWKQLAVAFIPTGIIGLLLYKPIKTIFLDNVLVTVLALLIGGVVLLIVDRLPKISSGSTKIKSLSIKSLVSIGLFQSLSVIPGVSRSAASIVGGLVSKLSRTEAVEFSFLLAIPTMIIASGMELINVGFSFSRFETSLLLIGSFFSFLTAIVAIKSFVSFVGKHNFSAFALYRIVLAVVILFSLW